MNIRQGDVGLICVPAPPRKAGKPGRASSWPRANGLRYVVEERVARAQLYKLEGRLFLVCRAHSAVVHPEHGAVFLEGGTNEIRRQREWAPERSRWVND